MKQVLFGIACVALLVSAGLASASNSLPTFASAPSAQADDAARDAWCTAVINFIVERTPSNEDPDLDARSIEMQWQTCRPDPQDYADAMKEQVEGLLGHPWS